MPTPFRADNIGSLLRPAELIDARTAHREKRLSTEQLREIEDRAIVQALELQKSAGVDVVTDGEYRRGNFMADFTSALDGLVPSESIMAPIWRGPNGGLASGFRRPDGESVVGGKLRRKSQGIFAAEAALLKTAGVRTVQSLRPQCGPVRRQQVQGRCHRQSVSNSARHGPGIRRAVARRSAGTVRRRNVLCPARRAILFDPSDGRGPAPAVARHGRGPGRNLGRRDRRRQRAYRRFDASTRRSHRHSLLPRQQSQRLER